MIVGIDLGTTYCCVAYFDKAGQPRVIPSAEGHSTTPSVVYFNGEEMCAGEPANQFKNRVPQNQIFDLFKPDMGKIDEQKRYVVNRQHYGPEGISALLLRKLKKDAVTYLKHVEHPEAGTLSMEQDLDAVITVPAYFRDKERRATMLAGYAAGLNVVHIINEPTAASLAHSLQSPQDQGILASEDKRILVFDLGGGTCDVTILEIHNSQVEVVATDGSDDLGGQDWDGLIEDYLKRAFYGQNLIELSKQERFTLQACARQAKHELTDKKETKAVLQTEAGEVEVVLHRTPPKGMKLVDTRRRLMTDAGASEEATFYFERSAQDLLVRCKNLCLNALEEAGRKNFSELGRSMEWTDLDEIVMAGGSCRMPMIPKMLEEETKKRPRQVEKFGYDVAVAIGAAYHGTHEALDIDIVDVVPCDIGVEVLRNGKKRISHLIRKNAPLPAATRRTFDADRDAHLTVYEGESQLPQECDRRGKIELDNPEGEVTVTLEVNEQGVLLAAADYPPSGHRSVKIKNVLYDFDGRAEPLREKVQSIRFGC